MSALITTQLCMTTEREGQLECPGLSCNYGVLTCPRVNVIWGLNLDVMSASLTSSYTLVYVAVKVNSDL